MKRRKLIATLAAGAAISSHPLTATHTALSFTSAMEIAQREIVRKGLAATHLVSALYAGVDRQTEGAAFAVIFRPREARRTEASHADSPARLKLLIHNDGRTALQPIPVRARSRA